MYYVYKVCDVATLDELTDNDYFIILEKKDIIRKTETGYDIRSINYDTRTVYKKESTDSNIAVTFKGRKVELDSSTVVQKIKIVII